MPEANLPSNIFPSLTYADAAAAVDWLCATFGFEKKLVVPRPDGGVAHSELRLGPGVVMVSSPKPDQDRVALGGRKEVSQALSVYVEDPDAHYARACAGGAEVMRELKDEEHGGRGYMARDLEGHFWYFGSYRPGAYWG